MLDRNLYLSMVGLLVLIISVSLLFSVDWRIGTGVFLFSWAENISNKIK